MPTPDVYDKFRSSPRYAAFHRRCLELSQAHGLSNLDAAKAASDAVLAQIKDLIRPMAQAERADAAAWLWGDYLDVPPFDRIYPLLTPAGHSRQRRAASPKA